MSGASAMAATGDESAMGRAMPGALDLVEIRAVNVPKNVVITINVVVLVTDVVNANALVSGAYGMSGAMVVALMAALMMAVSMPVAACGGIGAGLRQKGDLAALQLQAPLLQQIGQHRIFDQPQLTGSHLQRHMTVSEVISRPQQLEGIAGAHQQQGLDSRLDQHRRIARRPAEPFARLQRLAALQLQHQVTTAGAAAMAPQSGAVIGRERQPQGWKQGTGWRCGGAPDEGEGPG